MVDEIERTMMSCCVFLLLVFLRCTAVVGDGDVAQHRVSISDEQVLHFQQHGWLRVRRLAASSTTLRERVHAAFEHRRRDNNDNDAETTSETTTTRRRINASCTQFSGLARDSDDLRRLLLARAAPFGRIAAQLLQRDSVRFFDDAPQLFAHPRRCDRVSAASWRRDLASLPIDSNAFVTFWCALTTIRV